MPVSLIPVSYTHLDVYKRQLLGRVHTMRQFEESYDLARKAGFQNINVDLISAIPGQTVASWEHTLDTVIRMNPEHISAYSLIIEEGTPFYEIYGEDAKDCLLYTSFRCFLLRLGFIGKEYKTARKILLRNLTGNSAFRYGE